MTRCVVTLREPENCIFPPRSSQLSLFILSHRGFPKCSKSKLKGMTVSLHRTCNIFVPPFGTPFPANFLVFLFRLRRLSDVKMSKKADKSPSRCSRGNRWMDPKNDPKMDPNLTDIRAETAKMHF